MRVEANVLAERSSAIHLKDCECIGLTVHDSINGDVTYGSQSYYLQHDNVLYSSGSFGQIGYSDMQAGVSVIFFQDWAVNAELEKFFESRDRALAIIYQLRAKSQPEILLGIGL